MGRKMVIEITAYGITKTFTDENGKTYTETWIREGYNSLCKSTISSQLDQYGNYDDNLLLEILDDGDLDELWEHFEEVEGIDNSDKEMDCLVCTLNKDTACHDCCRDWDEVEDDD